MAAPGKRHLVRNGCLTVVGLFILLVCVGAVIGAVSGTKHSPATSGATTSAPVKSAAPVTHVRRTARHFPEYAGLGSTVADFKHANNIFCNSCALFAGEAAYTIEATHDGYVTSYSVAEDFHPAANAQTRISLLTGTMIPGPVTAPVRQSADCVDYRVPQLLKTTGDEYAEASTTGDSTIATMQAVAAPTCP